MSISVTPENKLNSVALTMETKGHGETWDDANYSWDDATGTWDVPGTPLIEETKLNSISLSLETK